MPFSRTIPAVSLVLGVALCATAAVVASRVWADRLQRDGPWQDRLQQKGSPATDPRGPKSPSDRESRSAGRDAPSKDAGHEVFESAGPWGVLQSYPIFIAAPDSLIAMCELPSSVTTWTFRGMSEGEVSATLDQPGLPSKTASELLDRSRWQLNGDEIRIQPPDDAVRSLPAQARASIYRVLARFEENEFQRSPFMIPVGDARGWLEGSGLSRHYIDAVVQTAYPVGGVVCFSDLPLLISMTSKYDEGRVIFKALSRTRTAMLRVRIDGPDDVAKIRDYWGAGDANAKDFLPLLESVSANASVHYLDVVHLLPPTPRRLMYTFPQFSMAVGSGFPDCHWTSLNFFRERPEPRLANAAGATMYAVENLRVAEPPFRYGDVLFMVDGKGAVVHSCVYLADEYVFTKNGGNLLSPWVIMKLDDVRSLYEFRGPVEMKILRP